MKKICLSRLVFYSLSALSLSVLFLFGLGKHVEAAETSVYATSVNNSIWNSQFNQLNDTYGTRFTTGNIKNITSITVRSAIAGGNNSGGTGTAVAYLDIYDINCNYIGSSLYLDFSGGGDYYNFTFSGGGMEMEANTNYIVYVRRASGDNVGVGGSPGYAGEWGMREPAQSCAVLFEYMSATISVFSDSEWTTFGPSNLAFGTGDFAVDYDPWQGILYLSGSCDTYGSGLYQMTKGVATSSENAANDNYITKLYDSNYQVNCIGNRFETFLWQYEMPSGLLTGTSTVYVNDTFFHPTSSPNMISVDINFAMTTTTKEWEFSVGYMSEDSPDYTATNLACTPDEWASTNWWTDLRCQIAKRLYIASFGVRDWSKDNISSKGTIIKSVFPYSVSNDINKSWVNSASATLPSNLAWINGADGSGNIKISVFGAATSTTIWGPAIFSQNASTTEAFANVKNITTYILWGLFILWLIYTAWEVKNHLHF